MQITRLLDGQGTVRGVGRVAAALAVLGASACVSPGGMAPSSPLGQARKELAAGNYAVARDAFRLWQAAHPADARGSLGLGAAFEGLGYLDSARTLYTELAQRGDLPRPVRRELEGRTRILAQRELAARARQAVANEASLSAEPPLPRTVAVLPLRYLGADPEYAPLERGLAHLLVSDLSQVRSLAILERLAVQELVDEMQLTAAGRVDPATGARSGRLLRAEHVIQGSFEDRPSTGRLRLDGDAVDTRTAEVAATASGDDRLQALFDLEKSVLLQLLERLGVQLTEAERQRIAERPTASLQAFLAFSRGLEAEDQGAYRAAGEAYGRAARLDPSFSEARQRRSQSAEMAGAQDLSLSDLAGMNDVAAGDVGFMTDNLNYVMGSGLRTTDQIQNPHGVDAPGGHDPLGDVEVFVSATLPITIIRPR